MKCHCRNDLQNYFLHCALCIMNMPSKDKKDKLAKDIGTSKQFQD